MSVTSEPNSSHCFFLLHFISVNRAFIVLGIKIFFLIFSFFAAPDFFRIPHSLSLDVQNRHLFVADRENNRVLVFDSDNGSLIRETKEFGDRVFVALYHPEQGKFTNILVFFVPAYDICKLKYSINNVILYLFSQGGVLHVVNGPFSSEALGFTFSLNSSTEIQRWKPRLVRPNRMLEN